MRIRSSLKWVFAVGLLAYAASPAGAQPGQGGPPPGAPPATNAGGAGGPNAQVGFERKTQLTPQEQLVEAGKHQSRMDGAAAGVRKMLEEARRQRDVVKTLCLNDKLSQIDVAIRSARDRRQQLQAAVNRNDTELANHEFTILTVLRQRVEQLVAEANQCIGEEAAFIGDTRTTVQVDPNIPPDETPYPPTDPTLVIGPPPCTSCTQ
jgi:hypothetical protein